MESSRHNRGLSVGRQVRKAAWQGVALKRRSVAKSNGTRVAAWGAAEGSVTGRLGCKIDLGLPQLYDEVYASEREFCSRHAAHRGVHLVVNRRCSSDG